MRLMSTDEAVRAFYRDRLTNDAVLLRDWFTDGALLSLNGSYAAKSEFEQAYFRKRFRDNPRALTELCAALVSNWHWHSCEVLQSISVGETAATRVLVDVSHQPTGNRAMMEFAEFIRFDGERITEMIAFLDTAAAAHLQGR